MRSSLIKKKIFAGIICSVLFFSFLLCHLQVSYSYQYPIIEVNPRVYYTFTKLDWRRWVNPLFYPTKIMCMGDSITAGWGPEDYGDGYRGPLSEKLQDAGKFVTFIGRYEDGDNDKNFRFHEGVPGEEADYYNGLWCSDDPNLLGNGCINNILNANTPDVILLHIGSNDVRKTNFGTTRMETLSDAINRVVGDIMSILDKVDDYETENSKEITVILALILDWPKPSGIPDKFSMFNDELETRAQARIDNNGDKIIIVDMENDSHVVYEFEDLINGGGGDIVNDSYGVHPNDDGYEKMADVWFVGLQTYFNTN